MSTKSLRIGYMQELKRETNLTHLPTWVDREEQFIKTRPHPHLRNPLHTQERTHPIDLRKTEQRWEDRMYICLLKQTIKRQGIEEFLLQSSQIIEETLIITTPFFQATKWLSLLLILNLLQSIQKILASSQHLLMKKRRRNGKGLPRIELIDHMGWVLEAWSTALFVKIYLQLLLSLKNTWKILLVGIEMWKMIFRIWLLSNRDLL